MPVRRIGTKATTDMRQILTLLLAAPFLPISLAPQAPGIPNRTLAERSAAPPTRPRRLARQPRDTQKQELGKSCHAEAASGSAIPQVCLWTLSLGGNQGHLRLDIASIGAPETPWMRSNEPVNESKETLSSICYLFFIISDQNSLERRCDVGQAVARCASNQS